VRQFCVIISALLLAGVSLAGEINLLDPAWGWRSPNPGVKIEFSAAGLTVSGTLTSTGIVNRRPLNFSTRDFDLLAIKMKTSKEGMGELSWASDKTPFSFRNSYPFYLRRPGAYHTYYVNLAAYDRDRSKITLLLLFPFSGPGAAEIAELKLVKGSLYEKIFAGWQEFFGPNGREQDFFNFLVVRSPRLFGRTLNYYVNFFLALFLAVVVILRKRWDLSRVFLLTLLAAWAAVELNYLGENLAAVRRQARFLGKSLEEKRALVNPGDFYAFLKFADSQLPAGAAFDIRAAGLYNGRNANYYLYPKRFKAGAPYLLIYDVKPDQKTRRGYRPWQIFRPGAYILKS